MELAVVWGVAVASVGWRADYVLPEITRQVFEFSSHSLLNKVSLS